MITMIRNPFDRAASAFFQDEEFGEGLVNKGVDDVEEYTGSFHGSYALDGGKFDSYLVSETDFFDGFEESTGIHIRGKEFDHNRSHLFTMSIQDTKVFNVVLLRVEDTATWNSTLAEYAPGFFVAEENKAEDKSNLTVDMYDQFKNQFMYSDLERAKLLQSDVWQYYNSSEVASMIGGRMVGYAR
jgi:hypothetical protein